MQPVNVKIFELFVEENYLNIGIRVRGKYNARVRKPIITVVFDDGVENRIMPMLIQAYYPNESLTDYTIFAGYKYQIPTLFFHTDEPDKISVKLIIRYGNETFEEIEYDGSSDLIVFGSENYDVKIEDNKKGITIKRKPQISEHRIAHKSLFLLQNLFGFFWRILLLVLSICLLPIFAIEGILALLGCVDPAPKNKFNGFMRYIFHIRWRINFILRQYLGFGDIKQRLARFTFSIFKPFKTVSNRVTFISNRRDTISGNYESIYKELVKDKALDIRKVLDVREGYISCLKYGYYLATSRVILVDDYVKTIYNVPRRNDNFLIQVWHACGAFKTFGFSRLGKPGGQKQNSYDHRNYDYCTVSSKEICKFYAEGFGLSTEKVVATGVPRTDIFFDEEYKKKAREDFYSKYPKLKDKKIILFAPTFRGNGKKTGFYPHDKMDIKRLYEHFNGEYAIIIKHHPFVNNSIDMSEYDKDYILDLSNNEELNDLLFVTDILITDYSSVVFEAGLLDIPMIFYAFDLQNYISSRGFYYEYDEFVPGKIVSNMNKLVDCIENKDFEIEKIDAFKHKFFDELDGKAGYRVANLIKSLCEK